MRLFRLAHSHNDNGSKSNKNNVAFFCYVDVERAQQNIKNSPQTHQHQQVDHIPRGRPLNSKNFDGKNVVYPLAIGEFYLFIWL